MAGAVTEDDSLVAAAFCERRLCTKTVPTAARMRSAITAPPARSGKVDDLRLRRDATTIPRSVRPTACGPDAGPTGGGIEIGAGGCCILNGGGVSCVVVSANCSAAGSDTGGGGGISEGERRRLCEEEVPGGGRGAVAMRRTDSTDRNPAALANGASKFAISTTVGQRRSRSLMRHASTAACSGRPTSRGKVQYEVSGNGGSAATPARIAAAVSPTNGRRPVRISKSTTASAQMSAR